MILIFSSYNTIYQEEWRSEYINPIDSIAIGDTDNDPNSEIFFGTRYGELLIFEYQENDYILEQRLTLGIDEEITHIFIGNFDNVGLTDIVATNGDLTIFFIYRIPFSYF